jgi:DNA-binding response OmpR family regulator
MPQIGKVDVVSDVDTALRRDFESCPALVLLDADLTNGRVWLTVRRTKARWPRVRVIILAQGVDQQAEAEAAGADAVLLQGFPAGRLVAAIVKLLPQGVM